MGKSVSIPHSNAPTNNPMFNNGGIMGSGIFGMFGSTVVCNADDASIFCMLSKTVNVIIMVIFLVGILYLIYFAFTYFFNDKSGSSQMTGGYVIKKHKSPKSSYKKSSKNNSNT